MAQYRAIFQNAYFKGLATAAVVTMGLAAGQAQAAQAVTQDSTADASITIDGTENTALTITESPDPVNKFANTSFIIEKGATSENFIKGDKAIKFVAKDLTISSKGDASLGLAITGKASDKSVDATFNDITITKGTLAIAGEASGTATVKAKSISLAGTAPSDSTITLGTNTTTGYAFDGSGAGSAITGDAARDINNFTKVTVGANSVVNATASASNATVLNAAQLIISGGEVKTTKGTGTTDNLVINVVKGELNKGKITTQESGDIAIKFAAEKFNAEKEFILKEGTLALGTDLAFTGEGAVKFAEGFDTDGKLEVDGSKGIKVSDKASIVATDEAQAKKIAALVPVTIGAAGVLDVGGKLDLTAPEGLNLDANASKGTIGLANATSKVKADEIVIGKSLAATLEANTVKASSESALALTSTIIANKKLEINADTTAKENITLGTADMLNTNKVSGFTTLKPEEKIAKLLSNSGTISEGSNEGSALTVENDKSLKIDNGSWTNDVALTLGTNSKKGSLVIGEADTTNYTAASLKFNAGSKLILTSGDITVGAKTANNLLQATLDFSDLEAANFDIGAKDSTMKVEDKGTIILSKEIAGKIIDDTANTKLKTVIGAKGTLKVNGNLDLKQADLSNSAAGVAGAIAFSGDLGVLQAEELHITGLNTALDIANGKLVAESLKLDGTNDGTKLSSGNYVANNTLTATANDTTLTLGQGAKLQLGNIVDGVAPSEGGRVDLNLDVNATAAPKGKVTVATGNWTGKNVTLTKSGDFVVGGVELKDNAKSVASFNAADGTLKIVDADSTVTIAKDSSATFAQLDQANGTINVSGTLTLTGKESGKAASGNLSYGVVTKAGDIKVDGSDAVLHLGETAVKAITFSGDSIKYDAAKLAEDDPFAQNITLSNFGTLKLDFAKDTKLTKDQIKALRDELIKSQDNGYLDLTNVTISDVNVTQNADNGNRYEITYEELQNVGDLSESVVVENLKDATVTGIEAGNAIQGVVGNLEGKGTTSEITIAGATLNKGENGFANNQSGTTVNMTVNQGGFLHLKNGGTANKITLAAGADANNPTKLIVTDGKNTIDAVAGNTNTSLQINGNTTNVVINKGLAVGSIETDAGSSLTVGQNANFKGDAKLAGDTSITGTLTVDGAFEASGNLNVSGDTTFNGKATLSGDQNNLGVVEFKAAGNKIAQGQTFASDIKLGNGVNLVVGTEPVQGNAALANGASATLGTATN